MDIIGDASKARLIAVFIDHLIAFALMLFVVALLQIVVMKKTGQVGTYLQKKEKVLQRETKPQYWEY